MGFIFKALRKQLHIGGLNIGKIFDGLSCTKSKLLAEAYGICLALKLVFLKTDVYVSQARDRLSSWTDVSAAAAAVPKCKNQAAKRLARFL
ncbi:conserved hypothetical protein [Ricinus communis]|uniref:Uncharacterized protein n=1 Tax=Ricinus communis TaxID=3988 RepID=B9RXL6_RICCO|nr:conserved hypothetical protein [Ricinus communis]